MYYVIEKEFKKNSWHKRDLRFILILSISYTILSILLSAFFGSIWYSYGLTLGIIPVQYTSMRENPVMLNYLQKYVRRIVLILVLKY